MVTGLLGEARVAAGAEVVTIAGGGDRSALERRLAALEPSSVSAVVSFGLAGSIDPDLEVGALVCPSFVLDLQGERFDTASPANDRQRSALGAGGIRVVAGGLLGVDAPVLESDAKAALRASHPAVAVDMESHVAALFARLHGLPLAVLRVISDGAGRDLPPLAGQAMRPDGSVDLRRVLVGLARAPGQLPALLATARDAAAAFRVLRRVRGLLGPRLGLDL